MSFAASRTGIALPELPDAVRSVDVCFADPSADPESAENATGSTAEQRVWSIDLRDAPAPGRTIPWPRALDEHLTGATTVVLRDSADASELARAAIRFTEDPHATRVVDAQGAPLALNKWGRLGRTLSGSDLHERILDRSAELIDALRGLGLRPFVVGGTLLGGVRDGRLLPHDDDADIAYLSERTSPADVAIEGFEVGRRLEALGYELVRHSATHMQLQFRGDSGGIDYYIDVFAAFFSDDGCINQPFHVRGPLRREQMLPFGEVEIDGRGFPAPADPEAWLVINYDEHWRTPLPGFRLNTPRSTVRRFENWFGSFHNNRHFWNAFYGEGAANAEGGGDAPHDAQDRRWRSGADWILSRGGELRAPELLELGAGAGGLSAALKRARRDRRVVAADYSSQARRTALALAGHEGFEVIHANVRRMLAIGLPAQAGFRGPFDLVANHLYEQVGPDGREPMLRLARMSLRSGGTALMTLYARRGPGADDDPSSWHVSRHDLATEARRLGLGVEFSDIEPGAAEGGRAPYGARFTLTDTLIPPKEFDMKAFAKRVLTRGLPGTTRADVDALTERVAELEAELDEYRRDRLRMAELMDLAEQRLTPGAERQGRDAP